MMPAIDRSVTPGRRAPAGRPYNGSCRKPPASGPSARPIPGHAELRRTVALWLTETLLPSRLPAVTVPKVKKLEEVNPMIAQHAMDWTLPWPEEVRKEGEAAGVRKGEAALLLRLLRHKFGHVDTATKERVHGAGAEELLEWGDRVLTANTLDEVFDGSRR